MPSWYLNRRENMVSYIKSKNPDTSDRLTIVVSVPVEPGWEIDLDGLKKMLQNKMSSAVELHRPDSVSVAFTRKRVGLSTLDRAGVLVRILEHKDAEKLYYNGTKVVDDGTSDDDSEEEYEDDED